MSTEWVHPHNNCPRLSTRLYAVLLFVAYIGLTLASQQEANEHNVNNGPSSADKRALWSPYVYASGDPSAYYMPSEDEILNSLRPSKRGMGDDSQMPGVLRFGKRAQDFIRFGRSGADMMDDGMTLSKKEMPGVLRFGKRSDGQQEKKAVPGVLRFGKRDDIPGVLRFGKRESDIPGVLRFGKRDTDMPGVLRFGKRDSDMPGVLRFGKRGGDMPGVLRFGKRPSMGDAYLPAGVLRFGKRDSDMPGVLRFGKKSDMPGVLRFGKRSSDMPGVLRFG